MSSRHQQLPHISGRAKNLTPTPDGACAIRLADLAGLTFNTNLSPIWPTSRRTNQNACRSPAAHPHPGNSANLFRFTRSRSPSASPCVMLIPFGFDQAVDLRPGSPDSMAVTLLFNGRDRPEVDPSSRKLCELNGSFVELRGPRAYALSVSIAPFEGIGGVRSGNDFASNGTGRTLVPPPSPVFPAARCRFLSHASARAKLHK